MGPGGGVPGAGEGMTGGQARPLPLPSRASTATVTGHSSLTAQGLPLPAQHSLLKPGSYWDHGTNMEFSGIKGRL